MMDWLADVEDDLRTDAYPEIEGLRSARLSEQTYAQFDRQTGTLLIAGLDRQQLLECDEVETLVQFLKSVSSVHAGITPEQQLAHYAELVFEFTQPKTGRRNKRCRTYAANVDAIAQLARDFAGIVQEYLEGRLKPVQKATDENPF